MKSPATFAGRYYKSSSLIPSNSSAAMTASRNVAENVPLASLLAMDRSRQNLTESDGYPSNSAEIPLATRVFSWHKGWRAHGAIGQSLVRRLGVDSGARVIGCDRSPGPQTGVLPRSVGSKGWWIGFEPMTFPLRARRSTTELPPPPSDSFRCLPFQRLLIGRR